MRTNERYSVFFHDFNLKGDTFCKELISELIKLMINIFYLKLMLLYIDRINWWIMIILMACADNAMYSLEVMYYSIILLYYFNYLDFDFASPILKIFFTIFFTE